MAAKKSVLQLSVHEEKIRKKVLATVSGYPGLTSIAIDDKTGKLTVVGEVDLPVIVKKLRKICNAEIVSVEVIKPPEDKKPEEKKPGETVVFSVPMNYPYQYYPSYASSYYPSYESSYYHHPCVNSKYVVDEPNTCVIM